MASPRSASAGGGEELLELPQMALVTSAASSTQGDSATSTSRGSGDVKTVHAALKARRITINTNDALRVAPLMPGPLRFEIVGAALGDVGAAAGATARCIALTP